MGEQVGYVHLKRSFLYGGECMEATTVATRRSFLFQKQECNTTCEDELLVRMRENGKRLNEILNVTQDDIKLAIREARKEWK